LGRRRRRRGLRNALGATRRKRRRPRDDEGPRERERAAASSEPQACLPREARDAREQLAIVGAVGERAVEARGRELNVAPRSRGASPRSEPFDDERLVPLAVALRVEQERVQLAARRVDAERGQLLTQRRREL